MWRCRMGWSRQHRRRLETGHLRARLRAERTGAILSTFPLFVELVRALGRDPGERAKVEVGVLGGAAVDAAPDVPLGGRRAGGGGRPRGRGRARQGSGDRVRARGRRGAAARPVRVSLASKASTRGSRRRSRTRRPLLRGAGRARSFAASSRAGWAYGERRSRGARRVGGSTVRRLGKDGRTGWLGRGSLGRAGEGGPDADVRTRRLRGTGAHSPKPWPFCASSDDTPPPFHSPRRTSWRMGAFRLRPAPVPGGPLTAAPMRPDEGVVFRRVGAGWALSGRARCVPAARYAARLVVVGRREGGTMIAAVDPGCEISRGVNSRARPATTLRSTGCAWPGTRLPRRAAGWTRSG